MRGSEPPTNVEEPFKIGSPFFFRSIVEEEEDDGGLFSVEDVLL